MKFQVFDSNGKELESFDELTLVDVKIKFFRNQLGNRYSIEQVSSGKGIEFNGYYDFEIRTEGGISIFYVARSVTTN